LIMKMIVVYHRHRAYIALAPPSVHDPRMPPAQACARTGRLKCPGY
jgi:hypothetical protein